MGENGRGMKKGRNGEEERERGGKLASSLLGG